MLFFKKFFFFSPPTPTLKTALKSDTDPSIFKSLFERGDLDFVEQLWVRMRKSESVSEKQSLFDQRREWEAAIIHPLSWFPFQAWLAIKTLQTAWNWSLTLSDLVTSNPGSEMFLLQSVHTHCISSQREDQLLLYVELWRFTSCRFTETAAALWGSSSCSRTTSRSTMSL